MTEEVAIDNTQTDPEQSRMLPLSLIYNNMNITLSCVYIVKVPFPV